MKKKKIAAVIICLAMTAGLLAGCSSDNTGDNASNNSTPTGSAPTGTSDNETAEATHLTFWSISAHADFYSSRAAAWNKAYPDKPIDLEVVSLQSADRQSKLLVALQTGEGAPDFCDVNIIHFAAYYDFDEVPFVSLNDLVADEKELFLEEQLDMYSYEGNLYGAPTQGGVNVVFYNTEIMDAAGVDIASIKTWDDFYKAGEQVLEKTGKPMTVIETTDSAPFQAMVLQRGSDYMDEDGNVIIDSDTNVDILEYLLGMQDAGIAVTCAGGSTSSEAFFEFMNDGGAACEVGPLWKIMRYESYMPDLSGKMVIRAIPTWEGEDCFGSGSTGGTGTVITNQCKNVELAKEFLYFAKLGYDAGIEAWKQLGFDPFRTDCWEDPELTAPRAYFSNENVFEKISDTIRDVSAINNGLLYPEAYSRVGSDVMYSVFETHSATPKEALTTLADRLKSMQ